MEIRAPHFGWLVLVAGVLLGATMVNVSGWVQSLPYKGEARYWKTLYDSALVVKDGLCRKAEFPRK